MDAEGAIPATAQSSRRFPWRLLPFGPVRVVIALILLVASALKAHQLATRPFAEDIWLRVAETAAEWMLGLWLLSGLFPPVAWLAGIACFALFTGITTHKLLTLPTNASCGCFGAVRVEARYTLVLDLLCLLALAIGRPRPPWRPQQMSYKAAGGLLIFAVLGAAAVGVAGYYLGAPSRVVDVPPALPPPSATFEVGSARNAFDFGRVSLEQPYWAVFAIRNPAPRELRVRSVDANCDCLKTVGPTTLPAAGEAYLTIRFTPSQTGPYVGTIKLNVFGPVEPTFIQIKAEVGKN